MRIKERSHTASNAAWMTHRRRRSLRTEMSDRLNFLLFGWFSPDDVTATSGMGPRDTRAAAWPTAPTPVTITA